MPRIPEPSLNEKQFLLKALQEDIRVDGRSLEDYRKIDLTFGEEYGVANIRLGKTRVLVQVSAEVTKPFADRPFDGLFIITTELSPMASPAFETNRPTEAEIMLSRLLEKTIRRSQAIDTESLCLIAAQKCWSVRADVHVLSHDGNLIDASCIGIMAALQHFRKPDVSIEGEVVTIYTAAEREPVPLSLLHIPLCVTFSFYEFNEGGRQHKQEILTVVDANLIEEQIRTSSMTISMNRHGEICQIAKTGGTPIEAIKLVGLTPIALAKVTEISKYIQQVLDLDANGRNKDGRLALLSAEHDRVS